MPDTAGNGPKWSRLWRSSSSQRGSNTAASEAPSEAPSTADMLSTSIAAVVVRAQPRDFCIIRQEWTVAASVFSSHRFLLVDALMLGGR
jgi:hypothetical protein